MSNTVFPKTVLKQGPRWLALLVLLFATRAMAQVTYNPTNFTFEAEDFNFGGGQFFDNIQLCTDFGGTTPDCYFDRVGFTNIDQYEINFAVSVAGIPTGTEVYRFGDLNDTIRDEWVDTYLTADDLRPKYTSAGVPDYEVRNIVPGEWLNYTRTFPTGNFKIYMRATNSAPLSAQMYLVDNGSNLVQNLTYLGRFVRNTASTAYDFVPLTDDSGTNEMVVSFPTVAARTLRITARAAGYRPNYYMFVPVTNAATFPPTVQISAPTMGAALTEGVAATITASATDPDGSVTNLQFYAGTTEPLTLITETNVTSDSVSWTPPSLGSIRTYTIRVVATDNTGLTGSGEITVTVSDPAIKFLTTADGDGADAELREQNNLGVTSGTDGSIRTRTASTGANNEIVALRFDLSGYTLARLTDVKLNMTSFRDDTSTRQVALYGVAQGTAGATGPYTTEDWDENGLTEFGYMPGLLATDGDFLTQSLNTSSLTPLGQIASTMTKGMVQTFDSTALSDFVRTYSGSSKITFLLAAAPGYTSTGQAQFASKEATSLSGGLPTGDAGDFAPMLQFKILSNALPIIMITNPVDGAELNEGVEVTIEADASDTDGSVTNVQFYAGTDEPLTMVGADTTSPYSATWTPPALGGANFYTIRAVAMDNDGAASTNEIKVHVTDPHSGFVSTAVGDGADVEMREQNSPAARNGSDLNTRFNANDRNEVVGLRFDLTGYTNSDLSDVSLNLTSYRTDGSTRAIDVYGVTQGAAGGSGAYTTETWSDTLVSAWGDLPGLATSDSDVSTMSLDTNNLTLLVSGFTLTGLTEGEVRTATSAELTSFIKNYTGSHLVTLLVVAGNTSGGQFRFCSKEATQTASGVLSGEAGSFAPFLQFKVGVQPPPDLNFTNTASGLMFTWNGSYKLQYQTNSMSIGISNNWMDYTNGGTSGVVVPIDPEQGTVFFRLRSP